MTDRRNKSEKPTEYIPPGRRGAREADPEAATAAAFLAIHDALSDLTEMVEDLAEGQATIAEYLKDSAEDRTDRREMKDVEQAALKVAEDAETLREDLEP
jgi:hypothetical protein